MIHAAESTGKRKYRYVVMVTLALVNYFLKYIDICTTLTNADRDVPLISVAAARFLSVITS